MNYAHNKFISLHITSNQIKQIFCVDKLNYLNIYLPIRFSGEIIVS